MYCSIKLYSSKTQAHKISNWIILNNFKTYNWHWGQHQRTDCWVSSREIVLAQLVGLCSRASNIWTFTVFPTHPPKNNCLSKYWLVHAIILFMKVYHCFNVYCFSGVLWCTFTVILFIALFFCFFCHCVYACVIMLYISQCFVVQLLLSCIFSCPLSMCRSMCLRSNILYVTKYLCPYPVYGQNKVHVRSSFHLKNICF